MLTAKGLKPERRPAVTPDFERSAAQEIHEQPFETDTCIGQWHDKKDIDCKPVGQIVRMFVDIVSKKDTFLLNIPQPFTPEDMRFTTKDGALYVFVMKLPDTAVLVKSPGAAFGVSGKGFPPRCQRAAPSLRASPGQAVDAQQPRRVAVVRARSCS